MAPLNKTTVEPILIEGHVQASQRVSLRPSALLAGLLPQGYCQISSYPDYMLSINRQIIEYIADIFAWFFCTHTLQN